MEDMKTLAATIAAMPGLSFSERRLLRKAPEGWEEARTKAALQALEAAGAVTAIGAGHYCFDAAKCGIVAEGGTLPPPPAPAPAEEAAEEVTEPAEAAVSTGAAVQPRKLTRLERVMERINALPTEPVFTGEEREKRLTRLVEEASATVIVVNEGVAALVEKGGVRGGLLNLTRVVPEEGSTGVGGLLLTACSGEGRHAEIRTLVRKIWPDKLTERWLRRVKKDVEAAAIRHLEYLTRKASRR